MARVSPLNADHEAYGALISEYGPQGAGILVPQVQRGIGVEYAAIRRAGTGAAIIDQPQRGTIEVRGTDRIPFLNRMITQELKGFEPFQARRAFWLNRKGRIDADLRLIELGDRLLLDLDVFAVERTVSTLGAFIIADDVELIDRTEEMHRLALHGQGAAALLAAESVPVAGPPVTALAPGQVAVVRVGGAGGEEGAEVVVDRQDSTGEPGYELLVPAAAVRDVYLRLARPDTGPEELENAALRPRDPDAERKAVRAGWHAYNVARIEAGWPIYMLDFGPDSLPHETGVLHDRVSFTKGCYLGQEVVARMQSLGKPKQRLVGLRIDAPPTGPDAVTAAAVLAGPDPSSEVVGAVTSAATSPMLGSAPVAFAMVKYKHTTPGTTLHLLVEGGGTVPATVQEGLAFWRRPA